MYLKILWMPGTRGTRSNKAPVLSIEARSYLNFWSKMYFITDPWRLLDRIKRHLQMAQPYSFNLVPPRSPYLHWGSQGLEDGSPLPGQAVLTATSPNLHQLVSGSNFHRVMDQMHHLSSVPFSVLASSNSASNTETEMVGPRSQSWSRVTSPLGKYVSLSIDTSFKVKSPVSVFLYHFISHF